MVKTFSAMLPLGTPAPEFSLLDTISGKVITLPPAISAKATVIMFICNHCPFVKHINHELTRLAQDYLPKNIQFFAINSNDTEKYPEDSPADMKKIAEELGYPFPYLFDETQDVARAYQAACTPDFFIFDKNLNLVYRGQLDDSRPGNDLPVNGEALRSALDAILADKPLVSDQKPSIGCNIKWKS